jgi:hypothetical protein
MIAGLFVLVGGVVTLTAGRVIQPWLRERVIWRPYGWAQVSLGLMVLIGTTPRIAGASAGLVFVLSAVALLPLAAGIVFLFRAQVYSRQR